MIGTHGNPNTPAESKESVPKSWKIKQDKDVPGNESKPLETIIEPHGNMNPPVEGNKSGPEGRKIK